MFIFTILIIFGITFLVFWAFPKQSRKIQKLSLKEEEQFEIHKFDSESDTYKEK